MTHTFHASMECSFFQWGSSIIVKSPDVGTKVCEEAQAVELSTTSSYVNSSCTILVWPVWLSSKKRIIIINFSKDTFELHFSHVHLLNEFDKFLCVTLKCWYLLHLCVALK